MRQLIKPIKTLVHGYLTNQKIVTMNNSIFNIKNKQINTKTSDV